VVNGLGRHTAFATPRTWPKVHGRFRIDGDPQGLCVRIGSGIDVRYPVEDGVGFGNLFLGLAFATVVGC